MSSILLSSLVSSSRAVTASMLSCVAKRLITGEYHLLLLFGAYSRRNCGRQQFLSIHQSIKNSVNSFCFLHAKRSLQKPPHEFGSQKDTKCPVVQQCCKMSKCCYLICLYAGQSKQKCCSSSTQSNDLHTRHSLSVLSRRTPSAQRPVSTRRPWHLVLNLLTSLRLDTHLTTDRCSAALYSGCIVLYNIKLLG